MVVISVFVIALVFQVAGAGSLTPVAAPAGTMHALSDVYDALVGNYDSSGVVASKQGSALQVTKCIINKINGSPCP
jgi:hypothetical protein